jgi:hypothetical protein
VAHICNPSTFRLRMENYEFKADLGYIENSRSASENGETLYQKNYKSILCLKQMQKNLIISLICNDLL